jgi:hypothetical protein
VSHHTKLVPDYHGTEHIHVELPVDTQHWLQGKKRSLHYRRLNHRQTAEQLAELVSRYEWVWPRKTIYFFSDLHADADALTASLVASGGVKVSGKHHRHIKLTRQGKQAHFLIGGDCFDKGPSNLELLRVLNKLHNRGAHLRLLAGNHDVRVLLGMRSVNRDYAPGCEHFFIRMGAKTVPFLLEINDNYLAHEHSLKDIPDKKECRNRLFPPQQWYDEFPELAADILPDHIIDKELRRIREKQDAFEAYCDNSGLSVRRAYAAAIKWQQLFLHDKGEFSWFYKRMRLAIRRGSFLFVHAGLDNNIAHLINQKGVKQLNREFNRQLKGNPLRFYYGPVANAIRTKYRPGDKPLTSAGARHVHEHGMHVIIHGHKNMHNGQRISLRKSLVNFECDVTLDRHSRQKEGLGGLGAGVTIIRPDKKIIGISSDHPYVKVFDPADLPGYGG